MSTTTETTSGETTVGETTADAPATAEKATAVGSVFVSNYPPFSFWKPDALGAFETALARPQPEVPLGLYLHVPFCRKRCKFCYFRVYVDKNADQIQAYLDALAREVEIYSRQPAVASRPLRFVYFGGGTPSYVAVKHLHKLMDRVKAAIPWDGVEEVTFECEPGTLTQSKVAAYREIGVTRLSLGIENFSDDILRDNGRAHLTHEIHRCLPWIREQGFDQLNVDLIAGMVGETWESWRDTVEKTIDVDPDSVTIYQMELPYNTVYSQEILAGERSPVADWETKRAWNLYAMEQLEAAGFAVSSAYTMLRDPGKGAGTGNGGTGNGAPKKSAPRFAYRDSLWRGADMLGTGIASFGHLGGIHIQNVSGWGEYLGALEAGELPLGRAFATSGAERLTRELILQMKLGRLDLAYFRDKFDTDPLATWGDTFADLDRRGMLEVHGREEVVLTRQGLLQVDALLPAFYDPKYRDARYT